MNTDKPVTGDPPRSERPAPQPVVRMTLEADISANSRIHLTTTSLSEMARVMAVFNLAPPAEVKP